MLRSIDGFQGGLNNFLKLIFLFLTHLFELKKKKSEIYDEISMMSNGHSIDLGKKMINLHIKKIFEEEKRGPTLLYSWAKLWRFWKRDTFQNKVDLPILQSCLAQD